jgi:tetratricopeptide (TPR) repeat protein
MKRLALLFITFAIAQISFGQEQIINAFKNSYTAEAKQNYSAAIKSLQNVYNENSYEINLRLGWLEYMSGNFKQSEAYYNKAIRLMPYAIEPKMGLIYPLFAEGKTSNVISLYQEILKINPYYYKALYNLGNIYYSQGKYTEALSLFKKLADMYPFDHDALLMYAWTNYKLKKNKDAKILFIKVLENNPNDKSAKQGLNLVK